MGSDNISELSKQAKLKIDQGQYTDAEYYFKQITKIAPDNWQAWYGRGLCFKRLESYQQAIYCFNQVTSLNPEFAKGWYNLGFCQSQIDNVEDALFHLNKATKLDSSLLIALVIKAWIYMQHQKLSMAEKIISHIKSTNPEFIDRLRSKNNTVEPQDFQIAIDLLVVENRHN